MALEQFSRHTTASRNHRRRYVLNRAGGSGLRSPSRLAASASSIAAQRGAPRLRARHCPVRPRPTAFPGLPGAAPAAPPPSWARLGLCCGRALPAEPRRAQRQPLLPRGAGLPQRAPQRGEARPSASALLRGAERGTPWRGDASPARVSLKKTPPASPPSLIAADGSALLWESLLALASGQHQRQLLRLRMLGEAWAERSLAEQPCPRGDR